MDAEIHTAIRTAVPLPGRLPAWSPLSVTVDGKTEAVLRRDDGYLWIVLPAGVHQVRVEGTGPAAPGEILLLNASGFFSNQEAFVILRQADLICLIVEAEKTTVPILQTALNTLNTAFKRVDGIIINRRRFDIPEKVLNFLARIRGKA